MRALFRRRKEALIPVNYPTSKAETSSVSSHLSRFTDRLVTLAKRAVSGVPDPAVKKGDGGYADWVVIVLHGLREFLDLPYRRLLDILHEMHGIVEKMGLKISELPDFTTVCVRKRELKMAVWRTLLRRSSDSPLIFTTPARYRLSTQPASTDTRPAASTRTRRTTPSDR